MTRKDFELIAACIRYAPIDDLVRMTIAAALARDLAGTNPRFDRERFIRRSTDLDARP